MTEFEKSMNGLPHVFDHEMMQMFHRACRLTREYNQTGEDETEKREEILSQLLKKAGKNLYTVNHAIDPDERAQGICLAKPIHIEDKVWLCGDVQVVAGVTIGEGAVIGAGSVVTKNIPPHVIAAGNPCRVIRNITDHDKMIK